MYTLRKLKLKTMMLACIYTVLCLRRCRNINWPAHACYVNSYWKLHRTYRQWCQHVCKHHYLEAWKHHPATACWHHCVHRRTGTDIYQLVWPVQTDVSIRTGTDIHQLVWPVETDVSIREQGQTFINLYDLLRLMCSPKDRDRHSSTCMTCWDWCVHQRRTDIH